MTKINIDILKRLVKLIDINKADNYNDWMSVLWSLKTIQKEYLLNKEEVYKIFKEFSKLSNKYDDKECEKVFYKEYNIKNKKLYTLGTLLYYAELNNIEETKKIKKEIWEDYKLKNIENLLNDKKIFNLIKKINDKKKYIEDLDFFNFDDFDDLDDLDDNDFYNLRIIFSIKDIICDYILNILNIIYYNDNLYLFKKGKWFEIDDDEFYLYIYEFYYLISNYNKFNLNINNNKSILIKFLGNFNTLELILKKIKSLRLINNINENDLINNDFNKYINDLYDYKDNIINYLKSFNFYYKNI
jgi:hypothetical protein